MNIRMHKLIRLVAICMCGLVVSGSVFAQRASSRFLARPWEIRYVLYAFDLHSLQTRINAAKNWNERMATAPKPPIYFAGDGLFDTPTRIAASNAAAVGSVLLKFDQQGRITWPPHLVRFTAKRNAMDDLVLIDESAKNDRKYMFAFWSQGVPGELTFSPAVCIFPDYSRYTKEWDLNELDGGFGCREWTAQLYDASLPYINVTSYTEHGNFIGQFIGWSRFTDPPKPVIGQQGTTWLCLHECPDGEAPGIIPDIGAWTTKHGYPMPTPPAKQPEYPDADFDWSQC